ncbi:RNA-directed RNA polymerase [Bertholletia excelsa]
MAGPCSEVALPPAVEAMLRKICIEQRQSQPDDDVRRNLAWIGEEESLDILDAISKKKIYKSLSGYIMHMVKNRRRARTEQSDNLSPQQWSSSSSSSPAISPRTDGAGSHSPISKCPVRLLFPEGSSTQEYSPLLLELSKLEFRKAFLILSYCGREKLENLMSASAVARLKDLPMRDFETTVWDAFGRFCCDETDRVKSLDWDSGKTHLYYCHVYQDGSYTFKGPLLRTTRTHLQRQLGDDNILIVKFAEEGTGNTDIISDTRDYDAALDKIAEQGILVGLRHYRFFVFKDGGKEEKKKSPHSSSVKCYFVRMESLAPCDAEEHYILSNKTVQQSRGLFMHVHTVSSLEKYMARLSLILSKTIKLQVDFGSVVVSTIEDICCHDENGCVVLDEDNEPLIHTDGTGYISKDLAMKIPKDFSKAKYINKLLDQVTCEDMSDEQKGSKVFAQEPPLLMQIRLFHNGRAIKGTLLVNKKLENTILVRPSMVKVEKDPGLSEAHTFNSLEIVAISKRPPFKAHLSKYLIALLSYGGVPKEFFLDILMNALEDAQNVYFNKQTAFRVALNHGEMDDDFTVARMLASGIPLNETYLQYRLPVFLKEERKGLRVGKLPINESFYLMGTADPTGTLNPDEVCVILESGQISGKVLVYRNPGLHFGDIHIMNAVYVKKLEEIVGNSKYGIFFSTKGPRSVASEIANGDFDGDTYWVSRNPHLLHYFKASKPWRRIHLTPKASSTKPSELLADELEHKLFQLFKRTRFQHSNNAGVAADSWMALMDRLLILGDDCSDEKEHMKETIHQLVDMYYDALDAPKSGKKVVIPRELRAARFPHYMERQNQYNSTSVLGMIYDMVGSFESEDVSAKDVEVHKLPCFEEEIPRSCYDLWVQRYADYRKEMREALSLEQKESKEDAAHATIQRYKELLYGAAEFEESPRRKEDIYKEALAIYHIVYDYAITQRRANYCGFAWKVAGSALFRIHAMKQADNPMIFSLPVLRELYN